MYRPWGSHCLLLPMVLSLYCLFVCSVIVTFICIKKQYMRIAQYINQLRILNNDSLIKLSHERALKHSNVEKGNRDTSNNVQ